MGAARASRRPSRRSARLRIHNDYAELFGEWAYWAPAEAARTEVDFLLRQGREWIALEATAGSRAGPDELQGLRAIRDLKGQGKKPAILT